MSGKGEKVGSETQVEKFKRLAREIGADEDEDAFKERLKRVAQLKPDKPDKGDEQNDK